MTTDLEFDLIVRAKQGDFGAFEGLYKLYKMPIYRTALAITSDRAVAEEILQEAFLRAYKHLDHLREDISLLPWLYRVTVNLAYDLSARKRRGLHVVTELAEWFTAPPLISPEKKVEDREVQDLIYEVIGKLEFKQRTTLVLFYLQDFSLQEIADVMECPVGTVKSRLYYARANLRRELLADERVPGGLVYEFT